MSAGHLQRLYTRSPVFLQNLLLTIYAPYVRGQRYGRPCESITRELLAGESLPPEEIARRQLEALRARALLALERVPAYRSLRDRAGEVRQARSCDEILRPFPILKKADVRSSPESFLLEGLEPSKLQHAETSGTTGTPLPLYRTIQGLRRNYAFFERVRSWRGLTHRDRTSTLLGRLSVPIEQEKPPFWRFAWSTGNQFLSSYHMTSENLPAYARALVGHRPSQIICYPSSGALVARGILEAGLKPVGVRAIFTNAETLLPEHRSVMEEAFGCAVADQYGQGEWTVWISQCERGVYHLHPEYGYLEVLDGAGTPLSEGSGRAVATGFVNDAMVLMRYETGDLVALGRGSCACGRTLPVIDRVEGRQDDWIRTPDGRIVGRLDPVFKGLSGIVEAQIAQLEIDLVEVRVVPSGSWSAETARSLEESMRSRLGGSMRLRLVTVDSIPRTKNGKFRAVIGLPQGAASPVGAPKD